MKAVRRAPYNPELIVWDRWRVPYAPAYGWRTRMRDVLASIAGRTPSAGQRWPSAADDEVERLDHEVIANHVWRIREAGHMVLAGIDWERPTGVTEQVPINRLADLKAALDRWDADMGRQPVEPASTPSPHDCCGDALFWCPSTQNVECSIHGGFTRCCDMPELHRSIPALVEGVVMGDGAESVTCTSGDHLDEPAVGDAWGGDEAHPDQRFPYCAECLTTLGEDFGAIFWRQDP